jgi:hypothetical protein
MKSNKVLYLLLAVLFLLSSTYAVKFSLAKVADDPGVKVGAGTGSLFFKTYEEGKGEVSFGEPTSDPDSGYIMAGSGMPAGHSSAEAWVVKLDNNGSIEWQKAYGTERGEWAKGVRQTKTGDYFVVGTSDPQHTFPTTWGNEWFIFKLDSNGSPLWAKVWGKSNATQYAYFVEATDDGGCVVAGEAPPPSGPNTFTVLKLNADGEPEFQKAYSQSSAKAFSIQEIDSGYIVAGELSVGYDVEAWILKLDDNGTVVWQKKYGGYYWDSARSIRQTLDGGYIVAGGTRNWGAGQSDVWVMKLDPDGEPVWQNAYGGEKGDWANSVWQTSDGGYIVAGVRDNTGGDSGDMWVLKLNSNGSVAWQRSAGTELPDAMYSVQEKDGAYFVSGTAAYGRTGATPWVFKLDDNGTIPDCTSYWTPPFSLTQTNAIPVKTTEKVTALSITPVNIDLTETDTAAVSKTQCSGTMKELPNLTPYKPEGWSDKVVVSKVTGTLSDSSVFYTADDLFVDLAIWNEGPGPTSYWASIYLYVDGVEKDPWWTPKEMSAGQSVKVFDYPIGVLDAGPHQIKVVVDKLQDIEETNESDNEYTKTITVMQPTGSIKVNIMPDGLAGAQWRVDGGDWMNSGQTVSGLTIGNHTVTFKDVAGWTTPGSQTVTVPSGQTITVVGEYKQLPNLKS